MSNSLEGFSKPQRTKFIFEPATWFAIALFFGCVTWGLFYVQKSAQIVKGPGAVEVANTRAAIISAGDQLLAVDRKGDRIGAAAMLDTATYLLRNIDSVPLQTPALQSCKLAAAHLADGVLSVSQGGSWSAKIRYQNALADCR